MNREGERNKRKKKAWRAGLLLGLLVWIGSQAAGTDTVWAKQQAQAGENAAVEEGQEEEERKEPEETDGPKENEKLEETKEPEEENGQEKGFELAEEGWEAQTGTAVQEPVYEQVYEPEPVVSDGGQETEEILHQPRILLESSSLAETVLEAGKTYDLQVTFRNRSAKEPAYNLKISASWEGEGIRLSESSGYQEQVAPGGSVNFSSRVSISQGAEQKNIPLTFTLEYEDEKGTACTGTEKSALILRQAAKIQVSGFYLEETVYATDTVQKELKVQNTGRAPVYNVQVTAEGEGIFPRETLFLGDLEAQEEGAGTLLLYVGTRDMEKLGAAGTGEEEEKYGGTEVRLCLYYEDAFGEAHEEEQTFETVIQKPRVAELKVPETKKESGQWVVSALLLGLLLLASLVIFLFLLLLKNRRRLADAKVILEEIHENEKEE